MSFSVRLTTDSVSVEPGATVPLTIEVENRGTEADRYEMQVEGIDPEWTASPEAVFVVEPGETRTQKIFFKIQRSSESLAGNYPFVLKVRSLESGDFRTVQGVVQVKAYHHLSTEISPKKGFYSPTSKRNGFEVTIINLGNTEHTLQLFGNDPEEACTYEFEHEQVSVGPGQQKNVAVEVVPKSTSMLGSTRLHGFSVTGRSVEVPSVVTAAQAQLEQRPFLTPGTIIFLALLAVIAAAWFALLPKPPAIDLSLSKREVTVGEPVTIRWNAQNATRVRVTADGEEVYSGSVGTSSVEITPDRAGEIRVLAVASRDRKESPEASAIITVNAPVKAPAPKITRFTINKRAARVGESLIISYKFNEAVVRAELAPVGEELSPALEQIEVIPRTEGVVEYKVVAYNKDGEFVTDTVRVTVTNPSAARVLAFTATPSKIEGLYGTVALNWQVSQAERVEISDGTETFAVDSTGAREFLIEKTTTFTLTAIDAEGRKTTKSLKVEVVPTPVVPDPDPTTGTTGTTSGPPPGPAGTGG